MFIRQPALPQQNSGVNPRWEGDAKNDLSIVRSGVRPELGFDLADKSGHDNAVLDRHTSQRDVQAAEAISAYCH